MPEESAGKNRTWIAIIELALIGLHSVEKNNPEHFKEFASMESKLVRMRMRLMKEEGIG